jgi:hypothetical protein
MSPDEVIASLNAFFDCLEADDLDRAFETLDPVVHSDATFTSAIGSEVEGRTFVGKDGARAWFADLLETMSVTYGDRRFRTLDDRVILLLARNTLIGRASGVEVIHDIGVIWELDHGLIRSGRSYASQKQAVADAEELAVNA